MFGPVPVSAVDRTEARVSLGNMLSLGDFLVFPSMATSSDARDSGVVFCVSGVLGPSTPILRCADLVYFLLSILQYFRQTRRVDVQPVTPGLVWPVWTPLVVTEGLFLGEEGDV